MEYDVEIEAGGFAVQLGEAANPYIPRRSYQQAVSAYMELADETAVDGQGSWTAEDSRYVAANGLPADSDPNKLYLPKLDEGASGWVLEALQLGDGSYGRLRINEGDYRATYVVKLPAAGEDLAIVYGKNTGGSDGQGDWLECKVATSALSSAVRLNLHEAITSPGVGQDDASLKADVANLEREVAGLAAGEHAGTATPEATDEEADAGTGVFARLWSPAKVWRAARAAITRAWLANRLGGYSGTITVSGNVLHWTNNRAGGGVDAGVYQPVAPSGGGGLAAWQAFNVFANALTATGNYTATLATATTNGRLEPVAQLPADGTITLAMLATSLRNVLAAKLDSSQVKARIESDPVVVGLQAFMDAMRRTRNLASNLAWSQHASSAYFRFADTAIELPTAANAGDRVRFVVAAGTNTFTTPYTSYADFLATASSNGQPASTANGLRFADAANDNAYWFSHQGSQLLVASENVGDYSVTPQFSEIDLKPYARLSGPLITENDLAQAIRDKLDEAHDSGLTTEQVTALITKLIAENQINADEVARKPVRFARASLGEDIEINAALGFQIGSTNFTLGQISQDDEGSITFGINNVGTRDQLRNYEIRLVGIGTYDFSAMDYSRGSGANDGTSPDGYSTPNGQTTLPTNADTVVEILRPITANSYLPLAGVEFYVMVKTADGRHWAKVTGAGIEDATIEGRHYAPNSVDNGAVAPAAVGHAELQANVRSPVGTSVDDGTMIHYQSGVQATRPKPVEAASWASVGNTADDAPLDKLPFWFGTRAQYNALAAKDDDTLYFIAG